jgi:hypothetical protein
MRRYLFPFTPKFLLCCLAPPGLMGRVMAAPLVTAALTTGAALAFGFNGEGEFTAYETKLFPEAPARGPVRDPSVTLRRICGLVFGELEAMLNDTPLPRFELPAIYDATLSPRRAFSCFACTDRKCDRRSCHFIPSSLPNFDRMVEGCGWVALGCGSMIIREGSLATYRIVTYASLAGVWRKPSELTAPRRFRNEIKALLCGSNMRRP